jgi:hypothetical protein
VWLKESIKGVGSKLDKKALGMAVALMLMSWTALPLVYYLLIRRKKDNGKEVKTEEKGENETIPG